MPPDDDSPGDGTSPHYADAADRLERVIDVQLARLDGINERAEHVTRLVGVLLGLALSILSLGVQFQHVDVASTTPVTAFAFALGSIGLLAAMVAAVVTYLNSRVRIGLDQNVGLLLSTEQYSISAEVYDRRLLGTYGHNIRQNESVIEANARRFRLSLVLLLVGVVYLTLAVVLSVGRTASVRTSPVAVSPGDAEAAFLWTTLVVALAATYILSGRYLTLEPQNANNE